MYPWMLGFSIRLLPRTFEGFPVSASCVALHWSICIYLRDLFGDQLRCVEDYYHFLRASHLGAATKDAVMQGRSGCAPRNLGCSINWETRVVLFLRLEMKIFIYQTPCLHKLRRCSLLRQVRHVLFRRWDVNGRIQKNVGLRSSPLKQARCC